MPSVAGTSGQRMTVGIKSKPAACTATSRRLAPSFVDEKTGSLMLLLSRETDRSPVQHQRARLDRRIGSEGAPERAVSLETRTAPRISGTMSATQRFLWAR